MDILRSVIFYITSFYLTLLPANGYIEGVVGQPQSFLPTQAITQSDRTISSLLFRGLFKYDNYGTLIADLADDWQISEDGLEYTVKIKDNQYWANGKKITSNDIIYTSFKTKNLSDIATDRIDELTVRFTLPNRFSPFLDLLTAGIMLENSEETNQGLFPVSSSSIRIVKIEKNGSIIRKITLFNTDPTKNIRKISFKYYSNEDEVITAAKLGEVDGFLAEEKHTLQNFNETKFPLQGVYYALFFNLRNKQLASAELRTKLSKVLPINSLISEYGITVQGPVSRSFYANREVSFYNFDDKFADNLHELSITLTVPNISSHVKLARIIKSLWEDKLNLNVELNIVDSKNIIKDVIEPRNFEILLYGQETPRDPDRYVYWHSTQKDMPGLNITGFEHVRADRALEEGRKELDSFKRSIHYNEFQKVISEQIPAVFLYHPYATYYMSKYIEGFGDKYTYSPVDRFLDIDKWRRIRTN